MKKQLFIVFLTFTFPFFAIAKPSNTELLTHLKTVKEDLEDMREEVSDELEDLPEEYGEENYLFLLKMITEIDRQLNHKLKNHICGIKAIELICNDMQTVTDISNIITTNIDILRVTNCLYAASDARKIALIKRIFTKQHAEYCKNHPDGDLTDLEFIELHQPDILAPFLLTYLSQWLESLLKEIDVKIKRLEKA